MIVSFASVFTRAPRRHTWPLFISLMVGSAGLVGGCAGSSEEHGGADRDIGSLGLKLQVAPGVTSTSVTYTISGNGVSKTGTIPVDVGPVVQSKIGGLPAGTSYTITLLAAASDGASASGSAQFDVRAGQTSGVTIQLRWPGQSRTGSVVVNGVLNVCPFIEELTVLPNTAALGTAIQLHGAASDIGGVPSTLTYLWTSSGGSLAGATTPSATLTGACVGSETVTFTVSDGDCSASSSATVQFVAASGGGDAPSDANGDDGDPAPDAGASGGDGKPTPPDAGSSLPDAGSSLPDAGSSSDGGAAAVDAGSGEQPVPDTLTLVATATAANTAGQTSALVTVPADVRPDDLAVVLVVESGTVTLTGSPAGFTTSNLAVSNHVLSYGLVGDATTLRWTTSGSANTGATAYFFRGSNLAVQAIASSATSGASYGLGTSTQGPAAFSLGYALFSIQLAVSNTPTVTAGPGDSWQGPTTDGKQLYTWSQPYAFNAATGFQFPAASGTLSASSTKRQAQVFVYTTGTASGG